MRETLELSYLTAAEALAQFRAKTLSPVEYLRAVIERCERVNPKLNAFTYTFFERALELAKDAEARYVKGTNVRPLEGIPVVIKDLHPVEGEITTCGSRVLEGVRSEYTAPAVQRLFDAGAIMHARSTTPEYAHAGYTYSALWGVTRNPWNLDYSPGGSSGGAGAALASGMTALADGTDGGGSIRIPSSACGVVGYKPPFGRNPLNILPTNFELLLMIGPMARSVEDVRLMQNVMCGPHVADITTLRPKLEIPEALRVGKPPIRPTSDTSRSTLRCRATHWIALRPSRSWGVVSTRSMWAGTGACWTPGRPIGSRSRLPCWATS